MSTIPTPDRPRCVCGAPWHGELLLHGDQRWAATQLQDLGLPVAHVRRAIDHQQDAIKDIYDELGKDLTAGSVVRWEFVLCEACWPDQVPSTEVATVNRWDTGIELFQLVASPSETGIATVRDLKAWLATYADDAEVELEFSANGRMAWATLSRLNAWIEPDDKPCLSLGMDDIVAALTESHDDAAEDGAA
ncbi:hypothetical protein [uncultured Nocardioides sp.]|uniref:hypothetical protein n=1 Tax=uncultured Nocardioides sp. TaxID=198441 RepID=UPI0026295164|nr:hypothetical protein [uncultured Nocardioides sp.]